MGWPVKKITIYMVSKVWDVVILVAILYVALVVPFNAAFNRYPFPVPEALFGISKNLSPAQDDCSL